MINQLDRLKYLRILQEDGSYYGDIPLAIDAKNVSMKNKYDLQSTVGDINYVEQEDITTNLRKIKNKLESIDSSLLSIEDTKADSTEINDRVNNLANFVNSLDLDINNLGLYQDYSTGYVYLTYKGQIGNQGIPLAILKGQLNQNVNNYVDREIEKIDKELPITVYIDSSLGNILTNKNANTVLTAYVYKGSKNITNTVSNFTWKKYDQYGILDESWTKTNTGNIITLTPDQVISKAIIRCEVKTD